MSSFDYCNVEIIGHCGSDPELIEGSHSPFAKVQVATNKQWLDQDGQSQQRTTWHPLIFNGKLAEVAMKILTKGDRIFVRGELQNSEWQDKEGNKRISTFIRVEKLINFSRKPEAGKDAVQGAEIEPDVADTDDAESYQEYANAGREAATPKKYNAPKANTYRSAKAQNAQHAQQA